MKRATKADRKTKPKPMPDQNVALSIDRVFTEAEMESIRLGYIARSSDDKWFIYCEDDTVYMHRSWTGKCMYVAHFNKTDEGYAISKLIVNRDPTQYTNLNDNEDISTFLELLEVIEHWRVYLSNQGRYN